MKSHCNLFALVSHSEDKWQLFFDMRNCRKIRTDKSEAHRNQFLEIVDDCSMNRQIFLISLYKTQSNLWNPIVAVSVFFSLLQIDSNWIV